MSSERAVTFECRGEPLLGILHDATGPDPSLGVLIVVGGPQYRVGSHRQFVLMARAFASAGFPTFRFDYRGMGDSAAEPQPFDAVDDDVRAAIDTFVAERSGLRRIVIFGLCDAASAAMIYAPSDARVAGLILANPWVRSASGEAKAYVRHYYGRRLLQSAFWGKVFSGEFDVHASLWDLFRKLRVARSNRSRQADFVTRMRSGVCRFRGSVLYLISERDLTADEFMDLCRSESKWREILAEPLRMVVRLDNSDHTFSARDSLMRACHTCIDWLRNNVGIKGAMGS